MICHSKNEWLFSSNKRKEDNIYMFCDTHGLNLPCEDCLNDRLSELEYLRKIEEGYKKTI